MENWGLLLHEEPSLLYDDQVAGRKSLWHRLLWLLHHYEQKQLLLIAEIRCWWHRLGQRPRSSWNRSQCQSLSVVYLVQTVPELDRVLYYSQWFGNLATPAWWSDLWLNEGFATYAEYTGVNSSDPQWDMVTQLPNTVLMLAFCTAIQGLSYIRRSVWSQMSQYIQSCSLIVSLSHIQSMSVCKNRMRFQLCLMTSHIWRWGSINLIYQLIREPDITCLWTTQC